MITGTQTLARTAWGENRGGGALGMQSIINVAMNRVALQTWYGLNIIEVCLKSKNGVYQFDCWMPSDPNYNKLIDVDVSDQQFAIAIDLAADALDGHLMDITNGATSYYAASMKKPPYWAEGKTPCANIANQLFFKDV